MRRVCILLTNRVCGATHGCCFFFSACGVLESTASMYWIRLLAAFAGAALVGAVPVKHTYSRVVVFGDSLMDNGNGTYLRLNDSWPADRAYYRGRFSNGIVWPEKLAELLDVPHVSDYAYGGATTNNTVATGKSGANGNITVPDVVHQVSKYLGSVDGHASPDALYILSGGSNDLFFGIQKSLDVLGLAKDAVSTLYAEAKRLAAHGAKHFLFSTLPNPVKTPYMHHYGGLFSAGGAAFFTEHANKAIRSAVSALCAEGINAKVFDLFGASNYVREHASSYGIKNTRDACLVGVYKDEKDVKRHECSNPDEYLSWDLYHPTAHTHALYAEAAVRAVHA